MKKELSAFISALLLLLAPSFVNASSLMIIGPHAMIKDSAIIVNTGIVNVKELEKSVKSGIEKEVVFTVELFRAWPLWPDEFVSTKKIKMIIKYDNLRDQYWASSSDHDNMKARKFREFLPIQNLLASISPISLGNIKSFETGEYYVRVVIESKSMEYPLLMGLLMHLIPETEMSLAKESEPFIIGEAR